MDGLRDQSHARRGRLQLRDPVILLGTHSGRGQGIIPPPPSSPHSVCVGWRTKAAAHAAPGPSNPTSVSRHKLVGGQGPCTDMARPLLVGSSS